jgi:hypothetical protein
MKQLTITGASGDGSLSSKGANRALSVAPKTKQEIEVTTIFLAYNAHLPKLN